MANVENVCPQVLRGVARELRQLAAAPPAGVKLLLRDDDLTDIVALIDGPGREINTSSNDMTRTPTSLKWDSTSRKNLKNRKHPALVAETPYAGGVFRVRLALGREYPAAPPRAFFLTKLFHPNVSAESGEVCVNTLRRDWRPELGLAHALLALRCLLIAPNADSALNAEAAALLRDRYDAYCARARLLTDIHARAPPAAPADGPAAPADGPAAPDAPGHKRARLQAGGGPAPARDRRRVLKRL